jgi:hypothetical protein
MGGLRAGLVLVLAWRYRCQPSRRRYRFEAIPRTQPLERTNRFIDLLEFVTKLPYDPAYIHGIFPFCRTNAT